MSVFLSESFIKHGLCGHLDKIELIRSARSRTNASHSFLFYGPKNIGKSTFAKLMTLSLNCLSPCEGLACYKCENCIKILNGRFEYLTTLNYKFGEIPIDDIRNRIISPCMLKVAQNIRSVYIINDARFFNSESANSFLKTLEEPIANVVFILITSSIDSMLPTIRSRCQLVRFDEPDAAAVKSYARSLKSNAGTAALEVIIEAAGSIGAAISALTSVNAASGAETLISFIAKLEFGLTAHDAAAIINRVYEVNGFCEKVYDFCSENILQLEELFDRIESECLSKQYLRLAIVNSLLYLAKKSSRRDYQAVCHELSHRIDLFYQALETRTADYITGFKNTITAPQIKELLDRAKRENARNKRDEFLKIISLILATLEKLYVRSALAAGKAGETATPSGLEKLFEKMAALYSGESLSETVKVMTQGHYRDVAANINVELYLERYLMSIIEK